jgi:NADH-quinone oxidoreductase subunit F
MMPLLEHPAASLEEYSASGGGEGLRRALSMSPEEVIEEIAASGLRGRGGGGFPTGEKWDAIRRTCSLADGDLEGKTVTRPCHGSPFDVTTGSVLNPPADEPVLTYPIRVEGDELQVEV